MDVFVSGPNRSQWVKLNNHKVFNPTAVRAALQIVYGHTGVSSVIVSDGQNRYRVSPSRIRKIKLIF